ncbi:tetratricopeptide repeat protein [candidate division KSB1 bacterium]|nr:tetratricopeptide repeat protein [candidate division KSB1 bacterium]
MKKKYWMPVAIVLSVAVLVIIGCQSKEVTSAKVYIQQDNWDKAIEQLEMAVEMYPNDAEAHYLLGEGYATRGEWEKMNDMFEKSAAINMTFRPQIKNTRDKFWVTNFNSGVNRINGGDIAGAIRQFKTCVRIDPKRIDAYRNLAVTYLQADSLEQAKKTRFQILSIDEKHVESIHALANIFFQLKEYNQVVELEQKALKINPDDGDAVANIALAYDYLGEKDKAIDQYVQALEKNPDDKDLIFNLARLNYMNNHYDEAIKLFNKIIEANPDDYDANLNVGNAYLSMGDNKRKTLVDKENNGEKVEQTERDELIEFYNKAIPYLEKAVEIKGDDSNVWNNLGVAYVNVGDAEKGKAAFDKAEELRQ